MYKRKFKIYILVYKYKYMSIHVYARVSPNMADTEHLVH